MTKSRYTWKSKFVLAVMSMALLIMATAAWVLRRPIVRITHTIATPALGTHCTTFTVSSLWKPEGSGIRGPSSLFTTSPDDPDNVLSCTYLMPERNTLASTLFRLLRLNNQATPSQPDNERIDEYSYVADEPKNTPVEIDNPAMSPGFRQLDSQVYMFNGMNVAWNVCCTSVGSEKWYSIHLTIYKRETRRVVGFAGHAWEHDYPILYAEMTAIRNSIQLAP